MKTISILFICAIVFKSTSCAGEPSLILSKAKEEFDNFKIKFNKPSFRSDDDGERFKIFEKNYKKVQEINEQAKDDDDLHLELNEYADIIAALESRIAIKKKRSYGIDTLSEQNVVDCARKQYGNNGCSGGHFTGTFNFLRDVGVSSDSIYPYVARLSSCKNLRKSAKIQNSQAYASVPRRNENAMAQYLAKYGPLSVAFAVSQNFQLYKGGIYHGDCAGNVNHAMTVVGYGVSNGGTPYWTVKNSYGTRWGEGGYIRVLRGRNTCQIADQVALPLI